ncbi:DUF4157 domain-containing protein (plasmid) [Nostoc sp. UHCC 0926]|uniref:eCIS core domain-containing protein n=1 Tax=Nostoc sp. UHCC 0926 TaxID=3025190 RepID=UPI00235F33C6|nr:DUF4157 domain-containing protein [Nostoc sp. UHCC 0926]WDD37034.1 DUF4157 domain-containing protein [Nostoc sp. UHCC 0926]
MTSKRMAQSDRQQKSDKPQESGILQRTAVRSVSDVGMQSTDDQEELALSNSAFSKDFSRVPISTTKPQQIMAKLTIGAVGDKYEQEADRVAAQVVQRINAPPSVRSGEDETVQREEMETKDNEARLMRSPIIQRRSSDGGMAATPDLEASINQARGGGQQIANNIRQPIEQAFGADFSGVKVHTDCQSDQLNRSIQARAFTTGQNVFFRQGEYNPVSRGGQELLAHELSHVVQQGGGGGQLQKQEDPIKETVLPKDRDELKKEVDQAMTKIQSEIKNTNDDKVMQKLNVKGRDCTVFLDTDEAKGKTLLELIKGWINNEDLSTTAPILLDMGLKLKGYTGTAKLTDGQKAEQILNDYLMEGRPLEKTEEQKKGKKDGNPQFDENQNKWAGEMKKAGFAVRYGPSASTGQLLKTIRGFAVLSPTEIEAIMQAVVLFYTEGRKFDSGGYHTAVEVWGAYEQHLRIIGGIFKSDEAIEQSR